MNLELQEYHLTSHPLTPHLATVKNILDLTPDTKLFTFQLDDPTSRADFDYKVGQFALVSAFGVGEAAFDISSLANQDGELEFAVRRVGTVTRALHELEPGDVVGVRGPYGNFFPMDDYKGKDIVVIGGGSGMAPVRSVINFIIANRADYGRMIIIHGARTPADLVFTHEFSTWASAPNTILELTVDRRDDTWSGREALIPTVVAELAPSPDNAVAIICGPPIMIKFCLKELRNLKFSDEQIVTTLESKMKCGVGKCGRCNVGAKYVCLDGPVFTYAEISRLLEEF